MITNHTTNRLMQGEPVAPASVQYLDQFVESRAQRLQTSGFTFPLLRAQRIADIPGAVQLFEYFNFRGLA